MKTYHEFPNLEAVISPFELSVMDLFIMQHLYVEGLYKNSPTRCLSSGQVIVVRRRHQSRHILMPLTRR